MAINYAGIEVAIKQSIKTHNRNARNAQSIDEALDRQAEGIAEAVVNALKTFQNQAIVSGGNCPPNAPLVGAKIT